MVTKEAYRDAMARLGAAVNVVTTDGPGGKRGFTASAVCSVTDDPPTLLVCVNRINDTHTALGQNGVLCINTLSAGQAEISAVFAGATGVEGEDRFNTGTWYALHSGAPVLQGAVVAFDCRIVQRTEIGSHTVFFAAVTAIQHGSVHDGLIYFGRGYHPVPAA